MTLSSFKVTGSTSRVRSAFAKVSPMGMVLWEIAGLGALWCQEIRVSLGEIGECLSCMFTLSRDTGVGDFRVADVLVGVCGVTAGWLGTGAGYCAVLIGRSVSCV